MTLLAQHFVSDNQLEAHASDLLRRYALLCGDVVKPPVPVDKVIERVLDIYLIWEPIPDQSGRPVLAKLVVKRSGMEIVVNEDKRDFFERHDGAEAYSLAHEVGHAVWHVDKASMRSQLLLDDQQREVVLCRGPIDDTSRQRERQAERFAAFLLMPRDLLMAACADMDLFDWHTLYRLREQFGVTISALTHRLTDLRLITITADRRILPYQAPSDSGQLSLWR